MAEGKTIFLAIVASLLLVSTITFSILYATKDVDGGTGPQCFRSTYSTDNAIAAGSTQLSSAFAASGVAKIWWYKDTQKYWVETLSSDYPAGAGCTWNDVITAQALATNASQSCMSPINAAHLHYTPTTSPSGPVAVIFCMGQPLPNYADLPATTTQFPFCPPKVSEWNMGGLFNSVVNGATSSTSNPSTTQPAFAQMMDDCWWTPVCKVYYNVHSGYSYNTTGGVGLARGTLVPEPC